MSTCTSPPSCLAAVSALAVASFSDLLSCSARRSVAISENPRFVLQFGDELGDRADLHTGLATRRIDGGDDFQPRRDIDAVIGGRFLRDRLLLRLHDVWQGRVA